MIFSLKLLQNCSVGLLSTRNLNLIIIFFVNIKLRIFCNFFEKVVENADFFGDGFNNRLFSDNMHLKIINYHQIQIFDTQLPNRATLEQFRQKNHRKTDNFSKFSKYRFFEVLDIFKILYTIFAIA